MNVDRNKVRIWFGLCHGFHDLCDTRLNICILCDLHDNAVNAGNLLDVCLAAAAEKMKPAHFQVRRAGVVAVWFAAIQQDNSTGGGCINLPAVFNRQFAGVHDDSLTDI